MKQVIYVETKMEYVDGEPKMVEKEYPAMLEGIQGDGSAIIYIDTMPYRVPAKMLKM
jgi:hypothetical protein